MRSGKEDRGGLVRARVRGDDEGEGKSKCEAKAENQSQTQRTMTMKKVTTTNMKAHCDIAQLLQDIDIKNKSTMMPMLVTRGR